MHGEQITTGCIKRETDFFFLNTQGTGLATGALSHLFAILVPRTYNNKTHTHGCIGMDVVLAVLDPNCSSQCFVITVCQLI